MSQNRAKLHRPQCQGYVLHRGRPVTTPKPSALFSLALMTLLLALPVEIALQFIGSPLDRLLNLLGAFLFAAALVMAGSLGAGRWSILFLVPLFLVLFVIRLLYYGLVHFSGQGFGVEFFVHLEPDSVRIAWHEYGRLARRALLTIFAFAVLLGWLFARIDPWPPRKAALGGVIAVALVLGLIRHQLPEWQLWSAWQQWRAPVVAGWTGGAAMSRTSLRSPGDWALSAQVQRWQEIGLLNVELPTKLEISTALPLQPKNLILVYVEALGLSVINRPEWPDLMPGFQRLVHQHGWIDHLHSSSHVTIEGVSNTQCGLLFPFRGGGSGFAGRNIVAENLPCLGDVLAHAGYHQTYVLGGGPMSFTGKGDFLEAHGYDDLRGWEYFRANGFDRHPGHWGISDIETLAEVRRVIETHQAGDQLFHVSTLTVGSHIPGYSYETCEPYHGSDDRYLDALHCADQVIVGWIDDLRTDGLLENTVLVVTGDHPVFANPDMHRLFGESVHDHRLPLIVIGEDLPEPVVSYGAGYDLAPTILDLLRIDHNARFALGRSLARPATRPDYFVTRGRDVEHGRPVDNLDCAAEPDQDKPPELPLNQCKKRELLSVLHGLTMAYSGSMTASACATDPGLELTVPRGRTGPVQINVGEQDLSNRFAWRGRASRSTEAGLFLVALNADGHVQAQSFIPEQALVEHGRKEIPRDIVEAKWLLIAWRPHEHEAFALDSVFDSLPPSHLGPGGWLISPGDDSLVQTAIPYNRAVLSLVLTKPLCEE